MMIEIKAISTLCRKMTSFRQSQKRYSALGLELGLLGLVEIRFRSNVLSSNCSRSEIKAIVIQKL